MDDGERVWRLMRGDEPIADLVVTGSDFPWLNARVRTLPGLGQVRPLFEEELRALEHIDGDQGAWQFTYDNIRKTVSLYPTDDPVSRAADRGPEFLLHVDGEYA
jgi:hypothetical protein